ncbi:geranylgeranyl diphosphate synthase [Sulfolobus acidocaldarius]|uniref:Geranylgeranyl diphosphate synthase n=4 Tax=Sulfolobus acidocaldarius TaxID=2285 RepID=GGPS_SULAC|nr:geranylgeranyl diphosphate synthase [Sulfolobus acidocaldarius]P39464.1 RecName: Full=Geranylgeranyl diphosphate synthase; Short=GGPP synthase; Short=GGPS [Sulfolobus acidocaldarius DSM 639]AAY79519.1 geranylgeranyl pyrophosphate synthetase [Sulfolobus acidocaldarius DSM 639]AGE70069.1 geranylgeranyl pyrophosphate synthetase [Sulfolobus acidocaldarius N8]AGE72344.1 geranylgeranyl pyrophosphate synthetase [Sulfolobus acidocaldarius Ron12/I]ALU29506.1 geranylgeranyl pyrophosphate synthase [Su
MSYFDNYFNEIVNSVNDIIKSYISGDVPKLYEASYHLFTSGGKRLRPLILTISSDLFGGQRERAYYAGAAIEVLHTFTLVHDDIMDQDNIRRGLPTVHVKYGLPLAILAGDLLHAKAFQLLTQALRGLPSETIIKAFDIFTRSIIIISEGQAVDMEFEDRIDIKEQEYLDMISRKTAALFSASSSIGALIAGANDNDVRLMSDFGTNLGIAFQIVDDILGLTADEKELGKPVFSDIREGKKTILVIKTLELCKEDEKKIVLKALGNKSASKEELMSSADIIKKYSLDYAYNLAEKYYKNAIDSLNQVSSKSDIPGKALKYLAEFTIRRRK